MHLHSMRFRSLGDGRALASVAAAAAACRTATASAVSARAAEARGLRGQHRSDAGAAGGGGTHVRAFVPPGSLSAVVQLDDPATLNTFSAALGHDVRRAVDFLREVEPGAAAAVLQGAGPHFSVGGNPYTARGAGGSEASSLSSFARSLRSLYEGFLQLRSLDRLLVCAVHGSLVGGAIAGCLHADSAVAEAGTTFEHGNLARGVCPLGMLSCTFAGALGAHAQHVYLQAARSDAAAARALGLVQLLGRGIQATKACAQIIAQDAARHRRHLVPTMRARRAPVDFGRLGAEAAAHAECQVANGGMVRSSLAGDESRTRCGWPARALASLQHAPAASAPRRCAGLLVAAGARTSASPRPLLSALARSSCASSTWPTPGRRGGAAASSSRGHATPADTDATSSAVLAHVLTLARAPAAAPAARRPATPWLWARTPTLCVRASTASAAGTRLGRADDCVSGAEELRAEATRLRQCLGPVGPAPLGECSWAEPPQSSVPWPPPAGAVGAGAAGLQVRGGVGAVRFGARRTRREMAARTLRALQRLVALGPPPRAVVLHVVDDVGSLASSGRSSQLETEVLERMVGALSELRVPVVGSTRGEVEGAALAAFLAADYRVGGQSSALRVRPGPCLPAVPGACAAYGPVGAQRLGLVSEMVDGVAEAEARAVQFASTLARHPAVGLGHVLGLSRPSRVVARARSSEAPRLAPIVRLNWMQRCGCGGAARLERQRLSSLAEGLPSLASRRRVPSDRQRPPQSSPALLRSRTFALAELAAARAHKGTGSPRASSIHSIDVHVPRQRVSAAALELLRGRAGRHAGGLLLEQCRACGEDEDPVSMALTAMRRLMRRGGVRAHEVGKVRISSASTLDRSKSVKSEVAMLTEAGGGSDVEGVDSCGAAADRTLAPLLECVGWTRGIEWDGRWAVSLASDVVGAPEDGPWSGAAGAAASAALIGAWPQPTSQRGREEAHLGRVFDDADGASRMAWPANAAAPCGVARGHVGALASTVGASACAVFGSRSKPLKASSTLEAHVAGSGISPRPQASVLLLRFERNAAPSRWPTARVGLQNTASALISLAAALVRRALPDRESSAAGRVLARASPSMGIVGMLESMAAAAGGLALPLAQTASEPHSAASFFAACDRRTASLGRLGRSSRPTQRPAGAYYLEQVAPGVATDGAAGRAYELLRIGELQYIPHPPAAERAIRGRAPDMGAAVGASTGVAFEEPSMPTRPAAAMPAAHREVGGGARVAAAAVREVAAELVPGVPADAPLTEAGLDSLGVAELHNRLSSRLGDAELPEALAFDFPTLRQLEAHVATLAPAPAAPTAAAAAPGCGSAYGATGGASGGIDGALLARLLSRQAERCVATTGCARCPRRKRRSQRSGGGGGGTRGRRRAGPGRAGGRAADGSRPRLARRGGAAQPSVVAAGRRRAPRGARV